MKESIKISESEKWHAVVKCDRNYDGLFLYGVKTTGIFCRPSCKSKTPVRKNVIFFDDATKAIETGFRPCKRCCPDKVFFEPDLELIKKIQDILNRDYNKQIDLYDISLQFGMSKNHLVRVFKQHSGFTPSQYIVKARINIAEELLNTTDKSIIEIAFGSGFNSLSNFYKCFKERTGYTPNEYRKSRGDL